jgi:DNA-3-methyladenine glycosylase II
MTLEYWGEATRHLARKDKALKRLIKAYPEAEISSRGDAFTTLARAIVGQQISTKAADSIWGRFVVCVGKVTPATVAVREATALRACGFSGQKVAYVKDSTTASQRAKSGRGAGAAWRTRRSSRSFIAVKGIGRWTARDVPHVSSRGPTCCRSATRIAARDGAHVQQGQGAHPRPDARAGRALGSLSPVATWYLWRSLEGKEGLSAVEALLFDLGGVLVDTTSPA